MFLISGSGFCYNEVRIVYMHTYNMLKNQVKPYSPILSDLLEKKKHRQGKLIVISGPSGVGKGTLVKQVVKESDGVVLSVSVTTRPTRPNEQEGGDYFFKNPPPLQTLF